MDMRKGPSSSDGNLSDFTPEDIQTLLGVIGPNDTDDGSQQPRKQQRRGSATFSQVSSGLETAGTRRATMERKRRVEQQRRLDYNQQMSALQELIHLIETESPDTVLGLPSYSPTNQAQLLERTCAILRNQSRGNQKIKQNIDSLRQRVEEAIKAGEETARKAKEYSIAPQSVGQNTVVMVPMVMSETGASGVAPILSPWIPQPPLPAELQPSLDRGGLPLRKQKPPQPNDEASRIAHSA